MPEADHNRIPYVTMAVLGVLFVLIAALAESSKPKTKLEVGVRAVVVPTGTISRTVVVAPCEAPVMITARNVANQTPTPGTTVVKLPPSAGVRTVVIPGCRPSTWVGASIPTAAFVPTSREVPGNGRPSEKPGRFGDPNRAQAKVILPNGSAATNIVVAPCAPPSMEIMLKPEKAKRFADVVPRPLPGSPDTVVAPPCP